MSSLTNTLLDNALKGSNSSVSSKLFQNQNSTLSKQQSGVKFKDFEEMKDVGLFKAYDGLQTTLYNASQAKLNNTKASLLLNNQQESVRLFSEIATRMQVLVINSDRNTSPDYLDATIKNYLEEVASILNSYSPATGFSFGGSVKNLPPIKNIETFIETSNIINDHITTNYTDVVPQRGNFALSGNKIMSIDIDATHENFANLISCLHKMKDMDRANSGSKLPLLKDIQKSIQSFSLMQAEIALRQVELENDNTRIKSMENTAMEYFEESFQFGVLDGYLEMTEVNNSLEIFARNLKNFLDSKSMITKRFYD
ncbi:MAG: hypothetical protein SFT91_01420 [Rickettsiaceae bacterium]|nr:hypothetical protein [Rickettsiaceae bacterium]